MPYKRNGKWYADIRPRKFGRPTGKRIRRLLPGITRRPKAVEAEQKLARELSGLDGPEVPLLSDFLNTTYMEWAKENKAAPQLDACYIRHLIASPQFHNRRLDEISVIQIEGYKRERRAAKNQWGRPYKASTLNNELNTLSRAFRLAVDSGMTRANPCRLVSKLARTVRPIHTLERADEPRLFAALAERLPYVEPLARAALLTGMRLDELLSLNKTHFDFKRDLLFLVHAKWARDPRKTEGLPLSAEACRLFLNLCRQTNGPLFARRDGRRPTLPAASQSFSLAARKAGLAGLRFHDLRHTFGTRLGEAGASPYTIARLMGHANIQTSMIYVHPSTDNLRRALATIGHNTDTSQRRTGTND